MTHPKEDMSMMREGKKEEIRKEKKNHNRVFLSSRYKLANAVS